MGDCHDASLTGVDPVYTVTRQTLVESPLSSMLSAANSSRKATNHFAHSDAWPTTDTSLGMIVIDSGLCNSLELCFYADGDDEEVEDTRAYLRLWRLRNLRNPSGGCQTRGTWLGDAEVTFGTSTVVQGVLPVSGGFTGWAKEIAVLYDRSLYPGIRQIGQGTLENEAVPELILDAQGSSGFVVQMVKATGTGVTPAPTFGFTYRVL